MYSAVIVHQYIVHQFIDSQRTTEETDIEWPEWWEIRRKS